MQRASCGIRFDSVGQGNGNRQWTNSTTSPCVMEGGSCKITPIWCDNTAFIEPAQGGGYHLTGKTTGIGYTTIGEVPAVNGTLSVSGFTFRNGDAWLTVTSCTAYPSLVGISLNMAGVTTDSQGEFSLFIPVYN
jgi:hypothetical protein